MDELGDRDPLLGEITWGSLLQKLQKIWDEVGEGDEERDKMLLRIEEECLDVYQRNVEQAIKSRVQLLHALSDAKIELANLLSALGEKSVAGFAEKTSGTIKEQLESIAPVLEQLWKLKEERVNEFSNIQSQIQKICDEISGSLAKKAPEVNESDLSLRKVEEYKAHLKELQTEKSDRLQRVLKFVGTTHDLCMVLGMDFFSAITEVHPSLNSSGTGQSKSISNDTLARLAKTVSALKEDKKQRLHKLQHLVGQLIDLWNLMEMPDEERQLFYRVTCNISTSADEVTAAGALAMDIIVQERTLTVIYADEKPFTEAKAYFADATFYLEKNPLAEELSTKLESNDGLTPGESSPPGEASETTTQDPRSPQGRTLEDSETEGVEREAPVLCYIPRALRKARESLFV